MATEGSDGLGMSDMNRDIIPNGWGSYVEGTRANDTGYRKVGVVSQGCQIEGLSQGCVCVKLRPSRMGFGVKKFVSKRCYFEFNAMLDRKPVERLECCR